MASRANLMKSIEENEFYFSSRSEIFSHNSIIFWFSFTKEAIFSLKNNDIPA